MSPFAIIPSEVDSERVFISALSDSQAWRLPLYETRWPKSIQIVLFQLAQHSFQILDKYHVKVINIIFECAWL